MKKIEWETGTLWKRLKEQTAHGLSVGALQPIETTVEQVDDGSIPFSIHIVDSLSLKEEAKAQQAKTEFENPFLPYEEDLYVTDIAPPTSASQQIKRHRPSLLICYPEFKNRYRLTIGKNLKLCSAAK